MEQRHHMEPSPQFCVVFPEVFMFSLVHHILTYRSNYGLITRDSRSVDSVRCYPQNPMSVLLTLLYAMLFLHINTSALALVFAEHLSLKPVENGT